MIITATARLSHLYISNEYGTKEAIPRYNTVTSAIVTVDTVDLRLAQINKKHNTARECRVDFCASILR